MDNATLSNLSVCCIFKSYVDPSDVMYAVPWAHALSDLDLQCHEHVPCTGMFGQQLHDNGLCC